MKFIMGLGGQMKFYLVLITVFFSTFAIADSRLISANNLPVGTKFTFLKRVDFPANTMSVNIAIDEDTNIRCNIYLVTAYNTDIFVPENYELTLKLVDVFSEFYTTYHFEESPISSMGCFSVITKKWPLSIDAFEELINDTLRVEKPPAESIEEF